MTFYEVKLVHCLVKHLIGLHKLNVESSVSVESCSFSPFEFCKMSDIKCNRTSSVLDLTHSNICFINNN